MMMRMMMMMMLTGLEREDKLSRLRQLPVYRTDQGHTPLTSEDSRPRTSPVGMERGMHLNTHNTVFITQQPLQIIGA